MTKFLAASLALLALCACNSTGNLPTLAPHLGGSSSAGSAHPPVPSATPSSIPSSEPAPAVISQAPCQDFTGLYETPAEEAYGGAFEWKQDGCNSATLTFMRLHAGGEGYEVESVEAYPSGCGPGADHCNEVEITESEATLLPSSIMAIGNCMMPHKIVYELLSDGTLRITSHGGLSLTDPAADCESDYVSKVEIAQRIGPRN